jgi:hypothetical protein
VRAIVVGLALFFALAGNAWAGGPYMIVGAAEDVAKQPDMAFAKAEMSQAKLAGLTTIRVTETWKRGERTLSAADQVSLGNAVGAATFTGIRTILSIYPFGSSVTPLSTSDQADFAAFVVDVAKDFPTVHDFIVGNEPNLNRFWLPQFGPTGQDAAATAYESLLATTYDALKALRPHSTIYGGALAPRGVDKPGTLRDTHSPTAFILDLGAVYRASGRAIPIMDAFAFHPYPETSSTGPNFPHPNSSAIGIADYAKLVGLLGQAFDGTAQRGSKLPILYDEFGIETQIPAAKASLYTGTEPTTTKPVDEATQAAMYRETMAMTFCDPNVMGLLLFHVEDEKALAAWQSGVYYVDGTPKSSLGPVRDAVGEVHRGVIAECPNLKLTPKLILRRLPATKTATRVSIACDVDCGYTVSLDGRRPRSGTSTGGVATVLSFPGRPAAGRHVVTASAIAAMNVGPPGSAKLTFTS